MRSSFRLYISDKEFILKNWDIVNSKRSSVKNEGFHAQTYIIVIYASHEFLTGYFD